MRTFAQIQPTFWTRGSGKKLRDKPLARLLALYLMTGPPSTQVGLYYVSRRTLLEESGVPESELDGCLQAVADVGIAFYDAAEELVYLPEGARYQTGPHLTTGDRKRGPLLKQVSLYGNHPFVLQWVARYYDAYNLANEGLTRPQNAPSDTPSLAPSDAPSLAPSHGAVAGAAAAPFSVLFSDASSPRGGVGGDHPDQPPVVADLQTRATMWVKDPSRAQLTYPDPQRWTETVELNTLVASTFGFEPSPIRTPHDKRVLHVLQRWAEGHPQASMRQAVRGAAHAKNIKDTPEYQTLATIFTDSSCVEKYCRLAKSNNQTPVDKSNRTKLTAEAREQRRKFFAGE